MIHVYIHIHIHAHTYASSMCMYIMYIHIHVYDIHVVLRFFNSRYKVSLTWDSNPRLSDFRSDALPTELASLTQG